MDKIGRCLPKGVSPSDEANLAYKNDPFSLNGIKKRCGGGTPGSDAPSYGSCPSGTGCGISPNARCGLTDKSKCPKVCSRMHN
jgi:hypothetical protein